MKKAGFGLAIGVSVVLAPLALLNAAARPWGFHAHRQVP